MTDDELPEIADDADLAADADTVPADADIGAETGLGDGTDAIDVGDLEEVDEPDEFDEPEFADPAVEPSGWQLPGPTGVQAVDEALEPLLDLDNVPTAEHVPAYEHAHRRLQDALADLDGS